jgi:TetR/AcrR family transcriptional repressor of multidrug resistance operon
MCDKNVYQPVQLVVIFFDQFFKIFYHYFCNRMNVQSDIQGKKECILKTTLELIKENGFHGTPISLIAQKAGVAAGTIYHYFESKDAIILELHHEIKKQMVFAMFNSVSTKKEYKQQFFEGWMNLCKYFINNPAALIFVQQFNSSPYLKLASPRDAKASVNKFYEFFQFGMDKGYLKQMEYMLIASVVFGCITSTANYHVAGRFKFKDDDLCKIANIIWDGIKYRPVKATSA